MTALIWHGGVAAQESWPIKPIKFIVAYPAGGNSDVMARLIAERLSPILGQPILVENKPGASGTIGTQAAIDSPADGYTFLMSASSVFTITPHLMKLRYDPLADLAPVAMISGAYGMIAARKGLGVKNVQELAALAKTMPGKLTFGSAGTATATHISGEVLSAKLGIQLLHIPYKGSNPALADLMGGHIDLIFDPVALAQAKLGAVTALAVSAPQRHPELPNVPTLSEQNVEGIPNSWFGLFAPRDTPPAIINRMATAAEKIVNAPEMREIMLGFSQYQKYEEPNTFSVSIRRENLEMRELFSRLGIKGE